MFTVTLIPGTFWASTDNVTDAKLNLTANPTISVTGSVADITDYSAVTATTKTFTVFDQAADILRVAAGHAAAAGQRVKVSSSGTLPTGLTAGVEYFLRPDVTNPTTDFTLHYTANGAANNTERVDVTSAGTGTLTLTYFVYATGAPFIFDSAGDTWEKGMISPENLPEFVGATTTTPGTRGAVPQPGPGTSTDYLGRDGVWRGFPTFAEQTGLQIFNRLNFS